MTLDTTSITWIAVVLVGLIILGVRFWSRSVPAAIRRRYREINALEPHALPAYWEQRLLTDIPETQVLAVLDGLARRFAEDQDLDMAAFLRRVGKLNRIFATLGDSPDREERLHLAELLDAQGYTVATLGRRASADEHGLYAVALVLWFFASVLRADGASHLAALSEDLEELDMWSQNIDGSTKALGSILADFRVALRAFAQLARWTAAEDRALYLGQALGRLLAAQSRLERRQVDEPSAATVMISLVLELMRSRVATALSDIRQRAQLTATLRTRMLTAKRQAVLVVDLRNDGQGHAENIVVELRGADNALHLPKPRQELGRLLRDQNARLEFPAEPRTSDRVRLRIHITYDDLERQGQTQELADVVELRHERADEAFRVMRPNPYVVGRPLTEDDVFIGRHDLFERLDANLQGAHQDNVVVLIGQRRMGKTSVLRRLRRHLHESYLPVLIDFQGMLGHGEAAFFHEIAATVVDELALADIQLDEPALADFDADPGGSFRRRFLRSVRAAIGGHRLLLVFDELEVLEERIADGEIDRKILPFFRSLMQHEPWVSFMFAGTHRLEELTGEYWGVLFNLAVYFQVGHLPRDEVDRLFAEPTRGFFDLDPLALDKAYRITGGHPHFSQLLARELVELRNREHLTYITIREINRVAEKVVDKGQLHIGYLWAEATRAERFLLLALVALLDQEGTATVGAAYEHLIERRIEPGDLPAAARALIRREILADHGGQLSFRIGLLREWIERYRDLESLILSEAGGGEGARA